jgi:hypothetical protein
LNCAARPLFGRVSTSEWCTPGMGVNLWGGRMDSAKRKRSSGKILKMLLRDEILKTAPGKEGLLYIPQRTHTRRMAEILKELTLSKDELWQQLNPTS